jgi:hypothetical protein
MLRTMLATFEKIVEYNKKMELNMDMNDQNSAATKQSAMGTIRIMRNNLIHVSADDMMVKYTQFKVVLEAFKKQIEYKFDTVIIEEQQEMELDLVSSGIKSQEKKDWALMMKNESMMNFEDEQLDRWMKLVLLMALVAIGINYLVQYQTTDAVINQTQKIMLFSEKAAEIIS